jgi:putative ABC transport system permease protein
MYVPRAQQPLLYTGSWEAFHTAYVIRTTSEAPGLVPAIRNSVAKINPDVLAERILPMKQFYSIWTDQPRFSLLLMGSFAALALLITIIGVYGVVTYSVSRRTHEIGIRMALGANQGQVRTLILRQGLILTLAGVTIGLAGAFVLTRFLGVLGSRLDAGFDEVLYGISPTDPVTFTAVSVLLISVALLACYIPARRATKIDPMRALRYE